MNALIHAKLKNRFRGFLPIVVDIETSGLDPNKHALLEICIIIVDLDENGNYFAQQTHFEHILPFSGAEIDPISLSINQIDPYQPLRFAVEEKIALQNIFSPIFTALKKHHCQKAILVGHNAWFDLLFIQKAILRTKSKSPFHSFTCFDTATLSGLMYGQTVLSKATAAAGITFNKLNAHSAIYDAEKTAELFCAILNSWRKLHMDI